MWEIFTFFKNRKLNYLIFSLKSAKVELSQARLMKFCQNHPQSCSFQIGPISEQIIILLVLAGGKFVVWVLKSKATHIKTLSQAKEIWTLNNEQ